MTLPVLTYPEARPLIQTGDLLLCAGSSRWSRAIQDATGSPYSHVGLLRIDPETERVMLYESIESLGVRDVPLSEYLTNYRQTGAPYPGMLALARHMAFQTLTPTQRKVFWSTAQDLLGYFYDKGDLLQIAKWLYLPRVAAHTPVRGRPSRYICSEYASAPFMAVDITIQRRHTHFVAPADFAVDPQVQIWCERLLTDTQSQVPI